MDRLQGAPEALARLKAYDFEPPSGVLRRGVRQLTTHQAAASRRGRSAAGTALEPGRHPALSSTGQSQPDPVTRGFRPGQTRLPSLRCTGHEHSTAGVTAHAGARTGTRRHPPVRPPRSRRDRVHRKTSAPASASALALRRRSSPAATSLGAPARAAAPSPPPREPRAGRGRGLPAGHPRQGRDRDRRAHVARRAPDRSVLHTSRDGTLRLTDAAGDTKVAGKLAVYTHDEEGLQGVGVDPDFAENRVVYLYYAPAAGHPRGRRPGRPAPPPTSRSSTASTGSPASSSTPTAPSTPPARRRSSTSRPPAASAATSAATSTSTRTATSTCRPATTPTRSPSDGYTPIDERADRNPAFDAQRSAGNTNDLRGKILRIKVADGRLVHRPGRQPLRARHGRRPAPRSTRWASATRSG